MSTPSGVASPSAAALALELLESDRRYFESAARVERLIGAVLACVPGLERVPAACVVHRVDPAVLPRDPARWLDLVEERLGELGCHWARLYLVGRHPQLEAMLLARGYRPQDENGYARAVEGRPPLVTGAGQAPVELQPITSDDDWAAKAALHRVCGAGPDGHESDPEAWAELERARTNAGYMRPFFIVSRGAICGAVGLAGGGTLLRLKNLVVHPSWRRMGIASAVLRRAHALAWREGWAGVGAFALAGDPCEELYRAERFEVIARQTEWMRPMALRVDFVAEIGG
ncbi:MAG TPA: GNAT family N-acetyltransferase [Gemmatimonadales bacterium]|nr:GNAT family N-acetyltransferase [Gemmatimonadales bacterium]